MMDHADSPGRATSTVVATVQAALMEFTAWFLKVCLDQVTFNERPIAFDTLVRPPEA